MKNSIFIIDGSSCIYRAYHAIPRFTTSGGLPTNAIYGFAQTLRKIIKTYSPDYIVVAFDVKGPTIRHELFRDYKAERPPMPDELSLQIPYIKEIVKAFNIAAVERQGFEADDVIATLVCRLREEFLKVVIVSGDKDMLQLASGRDVVILDYAKGVEVGEEEVKERFGVAPSHVTDLIGLAGDASDNIPGVKGIGEKTAAKLINRFGSMEGVFEHLGEISPARLRKSLEGHRDAAFLSKKLATLRRDVPFTFDLSGFKMTEPDVAALEKVLRELEFSKFVKELIPVGLAPAGADVILTEAALAGVVMGLRGLRGLSKEEGYISIALERKDAEVEGIAFSSKGLGGTHYMPINGGVDEEAMKRHLRGFMEDERLKKTTDDAKSLFMYFAGCGIEPAGVEMDVVIASYLLNPTRSSHALHDIAYHYTGVKVSEDGGAARRAEAVLGLTPVLEERLREQGLERLFYELEMPLSRVLADMEAKGVKVDRVKLRGLSGEIDNKLKIIEGDLYRAAGYTFNINSPKQLSELLFERLGLKPTRRIKTGYSTDEAVLTSLSKAHGIPRDIMNYRGLSKLKGTYVDSLLSLADPATGRVHTSFNQTVTATGRLSSSGPNLQNIPVRGEYAGRIRGCFIAEDGCRFICADYSQIELRLVAHFSKDPALTDAFMREEDIHTRTACDVFAVSAASVTPEMRRKAKAINFGIIYGMGEQGLSTELGITFKEARDYIDAYFSHYRKVKEFIETVIGEAKNRGYTETLSGRRRYIPELLSKTPHVVRLGERMAINTPIQGSAADIIKKAMLGMWRRLGKGGLESKMLLQIHDELIVEVPESELAGVKEMVKEEMEGALTLNVPVKVNMGVGSNWQEAGEDAKRS